MSARDVLKNFNLFVDGRGYAGQIEEFTPPKLTLTTDDPRLGGMDAPIEIDMGMEKLEASFSLIKIDRDVLALFGVSMGDTVALTARGALESWDGQTKAIVHVLRGKIKEVDQGTYKAGEKAPIKVSVALSFYSLTHDGVPVHIIDVQNMVRMIGGVDRLAAQRKAIGL